MKAYWFSRRDGTTEYLSDPAQVGKTHHHEGECIPCESGLHASPTPWDALVCARDGVVLWEVEIPHDAVPHKDPVDKYCGKRRRYLRCVDMERAMVFVCERGRAHDADGDSLMGRSS